MKQGGFVHNGEVIPMKVQNFRLSHTFFDAVAVRDDSGIEVMMYRGKPSEVVGANVRPCFTAWR